MNSMFTPRLALAGAIGPVGGSRATHPQVPMGASSLGGGGPEAGREEGVPQPMTMTVPQYSQLTDVCPW